MPNSARPPSAKHALVVGRVLASPPTFRISCSFAVLCIIDPEHRNNIALKNPWVHIWKNASCGSPSPTA